jgi:hypothetical protein
MLHDACLLAASARHEAVPRYQQLVSHTKHIVKSVISLLASNYPFGILGPAEVFERLWNGWLEAWCQEDSLAY